MRRAIVHLHGLGSSPASAKAVVLGQRLRARGALYRVPDLNVPSFERLTLSAVIDRLGAEIEAIAERPVALVGSSFGGLAALHFADRHPAAGAVDRLVLLAPALDLAAAEGDPGGATRERWRRDGWLPIFHHELQREVPVHYALARDLDDYDSFAVAMRLPTLLYQGVHDDTVPYGQSVRFAAERPWVSLRLLDAGHRLDGQLELIADGVADFLELPARG